VINGAVEAAAKNADARRSRRHFSVNTKLT
jgi:hypothetical protein